MPTRSSLLPRVRRLMRREAARREAQDDAASAVAVIPSERRARSTTARVDDQNLETLAAEARYHRERLALYRARVYASKPTRAMRLRELERTAAAADARLAHAGGEAKSRRFTEHPGAGDRRSPFGNER
jgi:hypothetical protein